MTGGGHHVAAGAPGAQPLDRGDAVPAKPKLVFFQWDHRPNADAARFLLLHMEQHVRCLSEYFEVTVVNQDCDYSEICDRVEPDLALFEAGYRSHGSRRIAIGNTGANPDIPKIGLHNGDPWCDRRAGFLSDMDQWGIETFFSISTQMPEYTPSIAGNLFIWPNFIDPKLYRDYGEHKTIPITLIGQSYGLYPWRQKVFPLISRHYPCLICPQVGYESRAAALALSGETYARTLNASLVVPACGTMGGEVVRKHFEIPGARACLLTERTPALEAAGFVDMENCVFADDADVLDRLHHLFSDPAELERISEAGYHLVHARHTLAHRPQILQWLQLHRTLQPGQRIVQAGPFADLSVADGQARHAAPAIVGRAPDRVLLAQGDRHREQGRIAEARACYAKCLDYVGYLPEARFRLALCSLLEGDAAAAASMLAALIEVTIADYGARDPDPAEWACFIIALICQGQVRQATALYRRYPHLAHEELDRVGDLLRQLGGAAPSAPRDRPTAGRKSIHPLPARSPAEWTGWVAGLLAACGQADLAEQLRPDARTRARAATGGSARPGLRARLYGGLDAALAATRLGGIRPNVPPMPEFRYLGRLTRAVARQILPNRALALLKRLRGTVTLSGITPRRLAGRRASGGD